MNTIATFSKNFGLLAVLLLGNLAVTAAQTVYCTGDKCWETQLGCSRACYYYRYGYYCCNDPWAGSGWAVALWVILCLLMIVCCVWCCIAAAADPRPIYAEPAIEVISVKTKQSTQPQAVSGIAGEATVAGAGVYNVHATAPLQAYGDSAMSPRASFQEPTTINVNVQPQQSAAYPTFDPVYAGAVSDTSSMPHVKETTRTTTTRASYPFALPPNPNH